MKILIAALIANVAAAACALPAAAQTGPVAAPARPAGTAAATLPNSFDRPAPASAGAAPLPPAAPAPAAEVGPDVKRAEDALRAVVAGFQGDSLDYAMFSDTVATRMRGQAATLGPLIKGFGALTDVIYVGQDQGAELFALDFANARTQWIIGFNEDDQIAVLLFRPAPAEEAAPASAPTPAPAGR